MAATGVAGPDPQDGHEPGEVWLGLAGPDGSVRTVRHDFAGDRATVREATVAAGKAAHRAQRDLPLVDAYAAMSAEMVAGLARPEAGEGIAAFLEKRPARWPDR